MPSALILIDIQNDQGLLTLFLEGALRSKKPLAKAPATVKVGTLARMATPVLAFLIATPREHAPEPTTRCCAPRADTQSARRSTSRLAGSDVCSHHQEIV